MWDLNVNSKASITKDFFFLNWKSFENFLTHIHMDMVF